MNADSATGAPPLPDSPAVAWFLRASRRQACEQHRAMSEASVRSRRPEAANKTHWQLSSGERRLRRSPRNQRSGLLRDGPMARGRHSSVLKPSRTLCTISQRFRPRRLQQGYATSKPFDPPWYVSGERRYASAQRSEQNHGPTGVVLRYAAYGACILQTGSIQAGSKAGANSMQ
jgi:hypothetical protein